MLFLDWNPFKIFERKNIGCLFYCTTFSLFVQAGFKIFIFVGLYSDVENKFGIRSFFDRLKLRGKKEEKKKKKRSRHIK